MLENRNIKTIVLLQIRPGDQESRILKSISEISINIYPKKSLKNFFSYQRCSFSFWCVTIKSGIIHETWSKQNGPSRYHNGNIASVVVALWGTFKYTLVMCVLSVYKHPVRPCSCNARTPLCAGSVSAAH